MPGTLSPIPILLALVLFVGTGCATVFGGRHNTLRIENTAGTQMAEVWLDGEAIGEAPGLIRLPARRIQHGSTLEIRSDGRVLQSYVLERKLHTAYFWIDVASTLGLALAIDFGTGHIYRPRPRRLTFALADENP